MTTKGGGVGAVVGLGEKQTQIPFGNDNKGGALQWTEAGALFSVVIPAGNLLWLLSSSAGAIRLLRGSVWGHRHLNFVCATGFMR